MLLFTFPCTMESMLSSGLVPSLLSLSLLACFTSLPTTTASTLALASSLVSGSAGTMVLSWLWA